MAARKLTVLCGPPGAGKTTVARALVAATTSAEAPVLLVHGDSFWGHFGDHAHGNMKVKFRAVMMACSAAAMSYAMAGFDTVLDFVVSPLFFTTLASMARKRSVAVSVVLLLPPKELCAARAAAREEFAIDDYSGWEDFYNKFAAAPTAHILRVTADMDADSIVARVREGLARGDFELDLGSADLALHGAS